MIWENGIKTCIIPYKKRITNPGSMQDTGSLGLVHWDDPVGWYGEGGGKGVQDGEYVYTRGRCMDKKAVVHIQYGVLLSYLKECI